MSEILDSVVVDHDPKIYECTNGLLLNLKKVSRLLVIDAGKKIKDPRPPTVYNPDKGRDEENPMDPDYIEAKQNAQYERGMVIAGAYLAFGTSINRLPTDLYNVDDHEWSDMVSELGIEVPLQGRGRYLMWLKYYAIDDDELNKIIAAIMRLSGAVLETDVEEAQKSFRNN